MSAEPTIGPDGACAAALAALPAMTPRRLGALLRRFPAPAAVEVVAGRRPPDPATADLLAHDELGVRWRQALAERPPDRLADECACAGISVWVRGLPGYPAVLASDPAAPPVLFTRGDLGALALRRAGVIGTRRCTVAGRLTAERLGAGLATAEVAVVSGLARGIDAAAHRGALRADGAAPIGVVASGLDVVYPREHARLWDHVAERGLLLGESPPGTAPDAHRFPLRNRILAACSEVLVVVESKAAGGSLITVREALRRDVTVMAVPGAPSSRAADGTNRLIADGAPVVLEVGDVLVALGLDGRRDSRVLPFDPRPAPTAFDAAVLRALGDAPSTLDQVVGAVGRPLGEVALALGRLEAEGWVAVTDGWFERADARIAP